MLGRIQSIKENQLDEALEFVKQVFTDSEGEESGELVKNLVKEIRSKKYYIPELELVMVNEEDEIIGFCMLSRFHIEGRYENEFVLLSPVAVKTSLQRRHISKDLIEYGLTKAREFGFTFCMVEGNPLNYRSRGFKTSYDYNVFAHESIGLPAPECLMIQELVPGALKDVHGYLNYKFYDALR